MIRLKCIYNFLWFHAVILSSLDVLCTFYIFFGTNLLIQCQVPVPVFSVFLTLFRSDFGTESKQKKNPEMIFSRTEEVHGAFGPRQVGPREPTSSHPATTGEAAVGKLVASLAAS